MYCSAFHWVQINRDDWFQYSIYWVCLKDQFCLWSKFPIIFENIGKYSCHETCGNKFLFMVTRIEFCILKYFTNYYVEKMRAVDHWNGFAVRVFHCFALALFLVVFRWIALSFSDRMLCAINRSLTKYGCDWNIFYFNIWFLNIC